MPRGRGRRSSNTNASSTSLITDDHNDDGYDAPLDSTTTTTAATAATVTKMSTSPTNAANAAAAAATPAASTAPATKPLPEQFAEFLTTLDNLLIKYRMST
jgi:septal ring-binding cell division protein DamX